MFPMSNKTYDFLSKLQRWLPALAVFYMALCSIWDLPMGQEVRDTILAVATLLAATLEISTGKYHESVLDDLIYSATHDDEPEEDEAQEAAE